ncbi:MAG TPA: primosomal protein N' [Bacteroidia bacterium]|nr:primosomal protein N' [Bacteroidia bacterium]
MGFNFQNNNLFVDVILPLALPHLYTYYVPDEFSSLISPGKRVAVQFGKQKMYSALIRKIHNNKPDVYEAKPIASVLDPFPIVNEKQFELWDWISDYYMCTLGEIMTAALPSAFKLESETKVLFNPVFEKDFSNLEEKEFLVAEALELNKELTLHEISKITGRRNVIPLVKTMIDKGILMLREELDKVFKPKKNVFIKLTEAANDEFLKEIFDNLESRAPKQLDLLMQFMKLKSEKQDEPVLKEKLLKISRSTNAMLNHLVKKNIFEIVEEDNFSDPQPGYVLKDKSDLNEDQLTALNSVKEQFNNQQVVLLHGVTSSGKTEIYIHLVDEQIKQGKQVLYLLPEIALTTQIINRLRKHYGEHLLVYHSKFNQRERAEVWNKMILFQQYPDEKKYQVIIGARSAIFLPFSNLGLTIVDEEHDGSYKQIDPAPRYNARDTSIILSKIQNAKTILGSATPSIESFFNAHSDKFGLVSLSKRFADIQMPHIEVVNLKEATKRKQIKSFFSEALLNEMQHALINHEQVILFQNRRGFAPMIECQNCHWIPHCINCDVTLTFHKKGNRLSCHYCGYSISPPSKCSACGDHDLRMRGYGTERIEDDITVFFPDKKIARLDLDSTRSKTAYQQIISGFENREIDILIGTQMITKGLDFDHVSLVGIINADSLMNFPHFRAHEKSFQLMAQVSGRAGRKFKRGKVIIQSYHPQNPIINFVVENDYRGFYEYELNERNKFKYPPYYRLTEIRIKHRDEKKLEITSIAFAKELKAVFGKRLLGPVTPVVSKIKNYFLRTMLLKTERNLSVIKIKKMLGTAMDHFKAEPENRSLVIQVDVDPL